MDERDNIQKLLRILRIIVRIRAAVINFMALKHKLKLIGGYMLFLIISIIISNIVEYNATEISTVFKTNAALVLIHFAVIGIAYVLLTKPFSARYYQDCIIQSGICNHVGMPILFSHMTAPVNNLSEYHFVSYGIPLDRLEDKKTELENALNLNIKDIYLGRNKREIIIEAASGSYQYDDKLPIRRTDLVYGSDTLILGNSYGSDVTIDLSLYPHILIGGTTGSGKTVLFKSLLWQCIQHGHKIFLCDFKKGIDFTDQYLSKVKIYSDYNSLQSTLEDITTQEIPKREEHIKRLKYHNLAEYNEHTTHEIPRIIVGIDELAEITDKTGKSKEDSKKIDDINKHISTIARIGRAYGVHLVLCTQRPDANVLTGQIKSNVCSRICGRADATLSTIIIGNSLASDKIPSNSRGMFVTDDGILFKGYVVDDK